jgi:cysteine desulfurase/selenocysteine lyase
MDWTTLREEFPITRHYNFQNHAAVTPMCRSAVEAADAFCRNQMAHAYLAGDGYRTCERIRQVAAQFIHANSDEICFIKNTSEGINFVANGLTWQSGDNIVTTNVEFPSNVHPWHALRARGVEVRMVFEEHGRIPLDRLIESINARTRVVAISSVQYASGFRTDLAALGTHCQEKGVLLCVDAIQSVGALPIDVEAMKIDFLAADGHKWMCGPEGLGIFYVRKEVQGYLKPTCLGWLSMKRSHDFDHHRYELRDTAKRYDSGAYNLMGIHALGGALDLLAGIGIEAISRRVLALTERLAEGVRRRGYHLLSSRREGEASGIVSFGSELHDHETIRRHLLQEHRIVVAVRAKQLRASPHIYNSEQEIDQLIEVLPGH